MTKKDYLFKIYFLYRLLIFVIFAIIIFQNQKNITQFNILFFATYLFAISVSLNIDNIYFKLLISILDILFIYFLVYMLKINILIAFTTVPIFFSCIYINSIFSIVLFVLAIAMVSFYSDVNMILAFIAYSASYATSYLLNNLLENQKVLETRLAFEEEFKDKLSIASRLSLEFAHEIRNPLMGISGALEIIKSNKNIQTQEKMIALAEKEIERAKKLTGDFLSFEKTMNGLKIEMNIVDFIEEFAENRRMVNNIKIGVKAKEKNICIMGDVDMLTRMFENLLKNSIEAKAENVTVKIKKNRGNAEIIFEDDGEGVKITENAGKIFMPFVTTKEYGTGLGLSICRKISEFHKGSIELFSKNSFKIILKGCSDE